MSLTMSNGGIAAILRSGEFWRIVRFAFIGGLATLVDLAVTVLMFQVVKPEGIGSFLGMLAGFAGISYDAAGLCGSVGTYFEEIVSAVSFSTAFLVSFFGHTRVTFRKKGSASVFIRLMILSVATLFLRALLINLMKNGLGLYGYVPVITAMVIVTASTYAGSKFWVFSKARDIGEDDVPEKSRNGDGLSEVKDR